MGNMGDLRDPSVDLRTHVTVPPEAGHCAVRVQLEHDLLGELSVVPDPALSTTVSVRRGTFTTNCELEHRGRPEFGEGHLIHLVDHTQEGPRRAFHALCGNQFGGIQRRVVDHVAMMWNPGAWLVSLGRPSITV
jgi:hypothetical protein